MNLRSNIVSKLPLIGLLLFLDHTIIYTNVIIVYKFVIKSLRSFTTTPSRMLSSTWHHKIYHNRP